MNPLAALVLAVAAPACALAQPAEAGAAPLLYAVEIRTGPRWDAAKPPQDQAFFREHSANLRRLREAGSLVLGARYADKGLVVVAAATPESVRAMMDADPAMSHGTFVYEVHEFKVFYAGSVVVPPRR